jgi:transaldolase
MTATSPARSAAPASALTRHGFRHVQIYGDGANVQEMLSAYRAGTVAGFTTNPTLMAKAGITDYRRFGRELLAAITDVPISFEVLADDVVGMATQARELASWGANVYVKIPIMNTQGASCISLIRDLVADGLKLNITAVMTLDQVQQIAEVADALTPAICSVFAGRIADTGRDPVPIMSSAVKLCAPKPQLAVLWASPREVLNVYQADECGCHIITVTPELLGKLSLRDKNLHDYSRETADMFFRDARRAGLSL